MVLVSLSFLICRIELLDTSIEFENAVENTCEKGSKEKLQLKSFSKTVIAFAKYFQYLNYCSKEFYMSKVN